MVQIPVGQPTFSPLAAQTIDIAPYQEAIGATPARTIQQIIISGGFVDDDEKEKFLLAAAGSGAKLSDESVTFLNQREEERRQQVEIMAGFAGMQGAMGMGQGTLNFTSGSYPVAEEGGGGILGNVLGGIGDVINYAKDTPIASAALKGVSLPVGTAVEAAQRTGVLPSGPTAGDAAKGAYEGYTADVPYVTPFMEDTVRPIAGDVGEVAGQLTDVAVPWSRPVFDRLGTSNEALGRGFAEAMTPTTAGDIALSLIFPATADWADAWRLAKGAGLIDDAGRLLPTASRQALNRVLTRAGKSMDDLLAAGRPASGLFDTNLGAGLPQGPRIPQNEEDLTRLLEQSVKQGDAGEAAVRISGEGAGTRPPAYPPDAIEQLKRDIGSALETGKPHYQGEPFTPTPSRATDIDRIEGLAAKPPKTTLRLYKKDPANVQKGTLEAALRKLGYEPQPNSFGKQPIKADLARQLEQAIKETDAAAAVKTARPNTSDILDQALASARAGEKPPPLSLADALGKTQLPPPIKTGLELPPEVQGGMDYFVRERRAILQNMPSNPSRVRKAVTKGGTGIDDPWLAEEIGSELELGDYLRHAIKDVDDLQLEQTIMEARRSFRDLMIADKFSNKADASAMLSRLQANDIERMSGGITAKVYDEVNNFLRTILLGVETPLAFVGQQGLRAGRGSTAIGTGIIARLTPGLRRQLYLVDPRELDPIAQLVADGAQFGKRGATADIARHGIIDKLSVVGKATDWLATAQFEHALGSLRLRADEGLLLQNHALHKLTFGKLGGDITDPLVRRRILNFGNTITSTARPAAGARRAAVESRGWLSPRMTRAQWDELLTPIKTLRSSEDAINTMNLVAGTALLFAAANEINKEIGIGDLIMDPTEYMFGRMTLKERNSKGENIVMDFLPQASLFKAIMRSVDAYEQDDWLKVAQAWAKFGTGRLSPMLSDAAALSGWGYGREGKFYYGDMNLEEKWRAVLPAPINIQQTIMEGETDPYSVTLALAGVNAYGESEFSEQLRLAEDDYDKELFDLLPYERAQQNMKLAENRDLNPSEHAAPYIYAGSSAFGVIQEHVFNGEVNLNGDEQFVLQYETSKQAREAFIAMRMEGGKSFTEAKDEWYNFLDAMGYSDIVRRMREEVIETDPSIIDSLDKLYQQGEATYPTPQWARDLAEEVQSQGLAPASGQ